MRKSRRSPRQKAMEENGSEIKVRRKFNENSTWDKWMRRGKKK